MRFTKMQGVGNDFVVLDAAALPPEADLTRLALTLCDRHVGVGADGLLVVGRDAPRAAFFMRMFNPDGTEDMCGNGLRCAGLWAHRAGWVAMDTLFNVVTKEGDRPMQLLSAGRVSKFPQLQVDMGLPQFSSTAIPMNAEGLGEVVNYPLRVADETYLITSLNTSSTHTVIFLDEPPDEEIFQRVSPLIELHPAFPERTSVLWASPRSKNTFAVRIWERGVGETLGCGTGACAVGVAAQWQGRAAPGGPVWVVARGGTLKVDWPGAGSHITLTGPAQIVFDGEFVVPLEALPQDPRQTDF